LHPPDDWALHARWHPRITAGGRGPVLARWTTGALCRSWAGVSCSEPAQEWPDAIRQHRSSGGTHPTSGAEETSRVTGLASRSSHPGVAAGSCSGVDPRVRHLCGRTAPCPATCSTNHPREGPGCTADARAGTIRSSSRGSSGNRNPSCLSRPSPWRVLPTAARHSRAALLGACMHPGQGVSCNPDGACAGGADRAHAEPSVSDGPPSAPAGTGSATARRHPQRARRPGCRMTLDHSRSKIPGEPKPKPPTRKEPTPPTNPSTTSPHRRRLRPKRQRPEPRPPLRGD
jgi:hypothetical protein